MLKADLDHQYYVLAPWADWCNWSEIQHRSGRGGFGFVADDGKHTRPLVELLDGPQGGGIVIANVPAFGSWFGIRTLLPHTNLIPPRGIGFHNNQRFPADVLVPELVPGWADPFAPRSKPPLKCAVTPEHVGGLESPHWLIDCGHRCKPSSMLPVLQEVGKWIGVTIHEANSELFCPPEFKSWILPPETQRLLFRIEVADQLLGLLFSATVYAAMCASRIRGSNIRAFHLICEIENEPHFRDGWSSFN